MQNNETADVGKSPEANRQRRIRAALDAGEDLAAFLGITALSPDQDRIAGILMQRWSKRRRKVLEE